MKKNASLPPPTGVIQGVPAPDEPPTRTVGGPVPGHNVKPLTGRTFGRLTVVRFAGLNSRHCALWECRCRCGRLCTVVGQLLRKGSTKSCGCLASELSAKRHRKNLVGQHFGRLTVIRYEKTKGSRACWLCRCSCGRQLVISSTSLLSGDTRSCGCLVRTTPQYKDIAGKKFGRLTAVRFLHRNKRGDALWECRCSCGAQHKASGVYLRLGRSRSCGCLNRDIMSARRGTKHPNWNAKMDQESRDRHRRGSPTQLQFGQVAKHIRKRDSNKCVICGAASCMLHVHHLEPWARAPKLRYSAANLVTLCADCHRQLHFLYGKDCDLEDFREFQKE